MLDGILKSALAVLGMTPDDARKMAETTVQNVMSVDRRLARIEEHLGIEQEDSLILDAENGGKEHGTEDGPEYPEFNGSGYGGRN